MGENGDRHPSEVARRTAALREDLHERRSKAHDNFTQLKMGLSRDEQNKLREMLNKLRVALNESPADMEDPAHGLQNSIQAQLAQTAKIPSIS